MTVVHESTHVSRQEAASEALRVLEARRGAGHGEIAVDVQKADDGVRLVVSALLLVDRQPALDRRAA